MANTKGKKKEHKALDIITNEIDFLIEEASKIVRDMSK